MTYGRVESERDFGAYTIGTNAPLVEIGKLSDWKSTR